ncbi:MAG TPA: hypothetical protein VF796_12595 [Humisphaera sp.]
MMDADTRKIFDALERRLQRAESLLGNAADRAAPRTRVYRPCVAKLYGRVKDDADAPQPGKYLCVILGGQAAPTYLAAVAMPEGMYVPDLDIPCLAIDVGQDPAAGPALAPTEAAPVYVLGLVTGFTSDKNKGNFKPGDDVVMFSLGARPDRVRISGDGGLGPGKYVGNRVKAPAADIPAAGALTAADLGAADAEAIAIVNAQEVGGTGHWLTDPANANQKDFLAVPLGVRCDNKPAYQIVGIWADECTTSPPPPP